MNDTPQLDPSTKPRDDKEDKGSKPKGTGKPEQIPDGSSRIYTNSKPNSNDQIITLAGAPSLFSNTGILNDLKRRALTLNNPPLTITSSSAPPAIKPKTTFSQIAAEQKARERTIANDNKVDDQKLKRDTLKKLFWFLSIETAIIFLLAFFQGFRLGHFKLDNWSFRLVITATLGQITAMLTIAVMHLFPKR